ncbi:MAG TPA: Holliday junction branch migration protein RuvA [Candidatus Binataceae bacterium]|nr:Holliday junction branch migration protein RuvA [Candidatus Binataceae bacterium]
MIATLAGTLTIREAGRIVIETGGVGYEVFIPLSTFYRLPGLGNEARLHIRQIFREDSVSLYGFTLASEKHTFDLLTGVQHVGPKLALAVLSMMTPDELVTAISKEDVERIDAVPGVGTKLAERVIRELRDKVADLKLASPAPSASNGAAKPRGGDSGAPKLEDDAISALINLGVKPAEAKRTVDTVIGANGAAANDLEVVIRKSLAALFGEK